MRVRASALVLLVVGVACARQTVLGSDVACGATLCAENCLCQEPLTATCTCLTPEGTRGNLLENPGFELGDAGVANGWWVHAANRRDTTIAHSGIASMRADGPDLRYTQQYFVLPEGVEYSLRGFIRTENVTEPFVRLRFARITTELFEFYTPQVTGTADWTEVRGTFVTPQGLGVERFDLLWSLGDGERAWYDDVELCQSVDGRCL
jgi:hypothetical protein